MQHLVRVDDGLRVPVSHQTNQGRVHFVSLAFERVSNPVAGLSLVFCQAAGVARLALAHSALACGVGDIALAVGHTFRISLCSFTVTP